MQSPTQSYTHGKLRSSGPKDRKTHRQKPIYPLKGKIPYNSSQTVKFHHLRHYRYHANYRTIYNKHFVGIESLNGNNHLNG